MNRTYLKICLLITLLSLGCLAETPEEAQARRLMEALSLSQQLGDKTYTARRLAEVDSSIQSIDDRVRAIEAKAARVNAEGERVQAIGDKMERDAAEGRLDLGDLNALLKGTASIARDSAEIGAESAQLGTDAAVEGLRAARSGLAGSEAASYYLFGLPDSTLRQIEARGSESPLLELARLRAARDSGQQSLVLNYSNSVSSDEPLSRFITISTRHEAEPNQGLTDHLKGRQEAFRALQRVRYLPEISAQTWRWAAQCQQYWLSRGSEFSSLEIEEMSELELDAWKSLVNASGEDIELLMDYPDLLLTQTEGLLRQGNPSLARFHLDQATEALSKAADLLVRQAPALEGKYPGLRVRNSPRLLRLRGQASALAGFLLELEERSGESEFSRAQDLFQQAGAVQEEIELLIRWPGSRAAKNSRLSQLSNTHKHRLGILVSRLNQAEQSFLNGDTTAAERELDSLLPEIRARVNEVGVTAVEKRHYDRAFALQTKLQADKGDAAAAMATLAQQGQLNTTAGLGTSSAASPTREVQQKRTRLRALEQEETAEATLPPEAHKPVEAEGLIASNKSEFVSKARELRESHPQYASLLFVDPVEFGKLQKKIPAGTLVLQYFPTEDNLYIFGVTSENYFIQSRAVQEVELSKLVRRYRSIVGRMPPPPISWKDDGGRGYEYAQIFYQLHEILLDPVEKEIDAARTVAIVPSGYLHYLPFAGLARATDDGAEFLVQRKEVAMLSKASDLALLGESGKTQTSLVAFGNPDGTLPGAELEVEELEGVFPGASVAVRDKATESRLRQESGKAGYLHLATHGTLDSRNPNASYITMARDAGGDDRLHPAEIFELPLSGTRLVTMSACSTALGSSNPGGEVTSLAEAFWVAGAPSVVASLWKVSDDSTRALMRDFYGEINNGETLASSLRHAQLQQLDSEFSHPYYWAPFVLLGDWR